MSNRTLPVGTRFETDLPARLDRLPWSRWHWRVVVALGITWILDGLEVTLVGSVASALHDPETLHLSEGEIGVAASAYLFGAIVGSLFFGRLTDTLGRKRLFMITLVLYLVSTLATSLSIGIVTFSVFRALTGAGIGGEYAAINSAIDELLPARVRGRADLAINSTYWAGTALGAAATIFLLDPHLFPRWIGWRLAFGLGAALGSGVLLLRRAIPESPRWLLLHGRIDEARRVVEEIEAHVARDRVLSPPEPPSPMVVKGSVGFREIARILLQAHRRRTILGLSLIVTQAFAYNAVFFTYALVLGKFYDVPSDHVGYYLLPFAAGNLLGPFVLGRFFDTIGRRAMIAGTYAISGVLLVFTGWAFARGWLNATTQTALWSIVFFVASSAASSAYLTVSELFAVELRGLAIALFYAAGTAIGGLAAPPLFGRMIEAGDRRAIFVGYAFGGALMLIGAVVALVFGVAAEGKSLEAIAALGKSRAGDGSARRPSPSIA